MPAKTLTLTIDDASVRILVVQGKRVLCWGSAPLDAGLVKDGVVREPQKVGSVIADLVASMSKDRKHNLVAGVSGMHSFHRFLSLPHLAPTLLAKAVERDMESALNVPLDQTYLFWKSVASHAAGEELATLALSRKTIDSEIEALQFAGLKPVFMELRGFSLARAMGKSDAVIIALEETSLDIVVVKNKIARIVRTIPLARKDTTEAKLEAMQEEFAKTLKLYETTYPRDALEQTIPIFVVGGLVQGIEMEKLSEGLGHLVEKLDPPFKANADFPWAQYMVNIGLAMKGTGARRQLPEMNLLPQSLRPAGFPWRLALSASIAVLCLAGAFVLYQFATQVKAKNDEARFQLEKVQKQMALRNADNKTIADLQKSIQQVQADSAKIKKDFAALITPRGYFATPVAAAGTTLLPEGVTITSISATSKLTIQGQGVSYAKVLAYVDNLKKSNLVGSVLLSNVSENKDGTSVTFSISADRK